MQDLIDLLSGEVMGHQETGAPFGHAGKLLKVDLTTGTLADEPLDLEAAPLYLEGTGLATFYLPERRRRNMTPLIPRTC